MRERLLRQKVQALQVGHNVREIVWYFGSVAIF
jgi:hypothetical protein